MRRFRWSGLSRGKEEIDARGLLVTPGWVDMHTHYDGQVTWDPHLSPSGWHGVTTVVMGNCGVGFAPCRVEDRDWLINVMEGVEDIPGSALVEGIKWGWQSFPEYMDAIERVPHSLDFAAQIPHCAVRGFAMGAKASEERAATGDEVQHMKRLVKEALQAGALGFSTSRTSLHKTAEGQFVAGTFAEPEELFVIGEAFKEMGTGIFECAGEHGTLSTDIQWMEELAFRMERPFLFNLSQTDFAPDLWREVLGKLEAAAERGAPLYAQAAGRAIGIVMNWRLTAHPFVLHPTFEKLASLPWEEQLAALRTDSVKKKILSESPNERGVFEHYVTTSFEKMFVLGETGYEPKPDQSIASRAQALGMEPKELAYNCMLEADGESMLYFPLFNYSDGNLDLLHTLHTHPRIRMGLSDGGAHCGAICDAGMPTFMLTHWTRDRQRGERMSLEWVIHRQTQQTAQLYGLGDRGVLLPGFRADVNIIDYDQLGLGAPQVVYDLPAGGRRLIQPAMGYRRTMCNGITTSLEGSSTGAMPGRLIRGMR